MVNKAYILKVDGTEQVLDHRPTLEEANTIVGGYIELVYLPHNITLVVDDEGRLKKYPTNQKASKMYGSLIVGNVIVLYGWKTGG
jgi:hypothetical protein